MIWDSPSAARASLREFAPAVRARHRIEKFWSATHGRYRYARVFAARKAGA